MDKNAIDFLIETLDKIDATIKNLENSPNRAFIMIDTNTLSLFHWFNWCFKLFWREEFDRKSASQLLLYKKIIKIHSELSGRYTSLFQEHIDYLKNVLTINKESSPKFNPVFFGEEKNKDIINYYENQLKYELDTEGKPLYKIDLEKNIYFEDNEKGTLPSDFYIFRSDSINNTHVKAFLGLYYCLKSVFNLMSVVCSYPEEIISGYKPSQEEIITALENETRQYAKEIGSSVHRELKKIFLEQKRSNSNSQSSVIWAQVLEIESEAFRLAISGKLIENREKIFDHYDEHKRKLWTDNYKLLQKIKDTCIDDEIFDVRLAVETYNLLSVLSADNLDLFYELVLRRNIIHSEMFPELKVQYDEWLNRVNEQPNEGEETQMSEARKSKLDEIIGILQKGNWKSPATSENIAQLLNVVFGRELSLLDEEDVNKCEKMWDLIEKGGGDRMLIVPANLAGFFKEENLLQGSPLEISNDLFGKDKNQVNNINKGKGTPSNCSNAFIAVIPFIRKYIDKVIRQA